MSERNKHFTDADRAYIEAGLRAGKTIREIADALSHDRTTGSSGAGSRGRRATRCFVAPGPSSS